ncbi:hypothetical protein BN2127_JRS4_04123 [Bacillus cereus]|nr:hypothetical protein BN2127_JRS4_04123 [Bacillus cereus]CUB54979.1 hypothetical protein BN2127_JRS10_03035 [Bacillus subtilis]
MLAAVELFIRIGAMLRAPSSHRSNESRSTLKLARVVPLFSAELENVSTNSPFSPFKLITRSHSIGSRSFCSAKINVEAPTLSPSLSNIGVKGSSSKNSLADKKKTYIGIKGTFASACAEEL